VGRDDMFTMLVIPLKNRGNFKKLFTRAFQLIENITTTLRWLFFCHFDDFTIKKHQIFTTLLKSLPRHVSNTQFRKKLRRKDGEDTI
jgi:hypothetical protein